MLRSESPQKKSGTSDPSQHRRVYAGKTTGVSDPFLVNAGLVKERRVIPALVVRAIVDNINLPPHIKTSVLKERVADDTAYRKINGKCKEEKHDGAVDKQTDAVHKNRLATLDIFAGCGGLSDGLQQAGVSITNWAVEYEQPAGEAFKVNHPEALVFINNCNVILRAIMSACGDADDCISTPEAAELAAELDEATIKSLPRLGQVDFISGGPPCQTLSASSATTDGLHVHKEVVARSDALEAAAYDVFPCRKQAFIWAASPEETMPEWPKPMHVFAGPELNAKLPNGAPFRAITVRDTIGETRETLRSASSAAVFATAKSAALAGPSALSQAPTTLLYSPMEAVCTHTTLENNPFCCSGSSPSLLISCALE
ncbi:hypothetical protein KPL71_013904 [Citrus sinensis]|uniref:Uncharacterized protein n=1 Tax=Citrus sinensis TaxID=2711 RepID=A0ACB8K7X3_CITSI|nr:hypothetical protein KPL71_013904 [Citrus sinensis]